MLRSLFVGFVGLWAITGDFSDLSDSIAWSQDNDRAERFFRFLDRNGNQQIDPDEYERMPGSVRERLQQAGVSGDRPISLEEFQRAQQAAEESRREGREERRREESRNNGDSRSSARTDSQKKTASKPKLTLALPAAYVALDRDKDGQIGFYEWERAKLAEFRQLDRNGDGFLTPRELQGAPAPPAMARETGTAPGTVVSSGTNPAPIGSSGPATVTALNPSGGGRDRFRGGGGPNGNRNTPMSERPPQPASTPAASEPPPLSPEERLAQQAQGYFKLVDKNGDGQISEEEWKASRGIRPVFERAGVTPTFPYSQADFVQKYREIKEKEE
ncbi:MAG: hypothetical protein KatS3mg113_0083 [Planctomycetaceae bacterium]|nr:MAG: hypothetical protein KatS3mg113_0083 [Planctomycetaceae bacterium]